MNGSNHFALMAEYNQWMNMKLYDICAAIPDEQRKKDVGAFFKSIHGTLNHLLFGDLMWLGRFTGRTLTTQKIGDEIHADFAALREARDDLDAQIVKWSIELTPAWLEADFSFTSRVDGKTRRMPAWIMVTHMFNHETHHRGQLTTLISQLGVDYGVTDILWVPSLLPYAS